MISAALSVNLLKKVVFFNLKFSPCFHCYCKICSRFFVAQDIDRFLYQAKAQGYHTVMDVGSRGLNLAANAVVTAAVKGQAVVSDRLKSYSTMDISQMNDRTPIHRSQSALGSIYVRYLDYYRAWIREKSKIISKM